MSGQSILIIALSGRALAASARRAGFVPLVVDGYGDEDARALAAAVATVPTTRRGFNHDRLIAAVEALSADRDIAGLVYGSGLEADPELIERLAARDCPLLGCSAATVRRAKDPAAFFGILTDLGIVHPETRTTRPADPQGWLSKRIGASGGGHVRRLSGRAGKTGKPQPPGRYYQRETTGETISVMGLVGRTGPAFAFTRPWVSPAPGAPFRYGGSVSIDAVDADLEARLIDSAMAVANALGLVGLVSLDFLIDGNGEAYLLEVNPRAGATLDILDDDAGTLFAAHVSACRGEDAVGLVARSWTPKPRASAYLYADQGPITVPAALDWPDWVSDIPAPGQRLREGAPVCTIHAEGRTSDEAYQLSHERLALVTEKLDEPH